MTLAVNIAQSGSNNQTFRNRIINGAMTIDQRNAGASVTIGSASVTYTVDRFWAFADSASRFSVQQNAGSVTPPTGFTNYLGCTSLSAYSVTSGDRFVIAQSIEGFNVADLAWGTANAQPITVSFWVRSSLTGTFGGAIRNNALNRSYPFSYTISAANTWEQKTITVAGDTSGTWLTQSGAGLIVDWSLGSGSTFSGTAGSWSGSNFTSATGATSVVGTNGATWYITGVQLEEGTAASPFEFRQYGTELQLCQRYCQVLSGGGNMRYFVAGNAGGTFAFPTYFHKTTMRAAPTLSISSASHFTFETWTSAQQVLSTIGLNVPTPDSTTVTITVPSSLATGGNVFGNNSSAQAVFSAEL